MSTLNFRNCPCCWGPALLAAIALLPEPAMAQVTPDQTLGAEASRVVNGVAAGDAAELIRGGVRREGNLFHSFRRFSIGEGQRVYFDNPAGVERVFGRVTGELRSDIFGTLGSLGGADLFLLNPNGIVFGPNARLDVGGSFVASTADAFEFAEIGRFSARSPEAPAPLLTIQPSALVFGPVPLGDIVVRSQVDGVGLAVPDGEHLALLGGNVSVDGGFLTALGGRVELVAVAEGEVSLAPTGALRIAPGLALGVVRLENEAAVDVRSAGGGDIGVTAQNVYILGNSTLTAGIGEGLVAKSRAGDVVINAIARVRLDDGSRISNNVEQGAVGRGGNIEITTGVLEGINGGTLVADTSGEGDTGNITILASDRVTFSGFGFTGPDRNELAISGAFSIVRPSGRGAGGTIEITAPVLEVLIGAQLQSFTNGVGDAGNVMVTASDRVTFAGVDEGGFPSSVLSDVFNEGMGSGGRIEITTPVLELLDGALLAVGVFGEGDAGSVIIEASDRVTLAGDSQVSSDVFEGGVGDGGLIRVTAPVIEVLDGALLSTTTSGEGNAGRIDMTASDRVTFAGIGERGFNSAAFSRVREGGIGTGGSIDITAPVIEVLDGAQLAVSTRGVGNAGRISITASDRVIFAGEGVGIAESDGELRSLPSGAFSNVAEGARGAGGDIDITAPVLEVLGGGRLTASTDARGNAGDIIFSISDRILLRDGEVLATSEGSGAGGDIAVTAPRLILTNQSEVTTRTISTDGGNITLTLGDLLALTGNSTISTEAGTDQAGGDGGDITITTPFLVSNFSEDSDIVADAFDGSGGNVSITASGGVFGIAPRDFRTPESDITASSQNGVSGTITLDSPEVDPSQSTAELPSAFNAPDVVQSCRERFAATGSSFVVTGRGGIPQGPQDPQPTLLWQDALPIEAEAEVEETAPQGSSAAPSSIVEAQGWVKNDQGQVVLVAGTSAAVGQPLACEG